MPAGGGGGGGGLPRELSVKERFLYYGGVHKLRFDCTQFFSL